MIQKTKLMTVILAVTAYGLLSLACATQSRDAADNSATSSRMAATPVGARETAALSSNDSHFLMEAAQGGQAEVKLGQLAAERAASSDVKQFGQRMVDDHTRANQELMRIAGNKNVDLPQQPNAEQQETYDRLSKLSGAAFDRAYMSDMLKDHEKDVADFDKTSKQASDTDVKAFATQTLPTLQEHLQIARTISSKLGAK